MTMDSQTERPRSGFESPTEQGDSSSAEDVESPRSVVAAARRAGGAGRLRRWHKASSGGGDKIQSSKSHDHYLHSQVVRIKEEEMHIGEDFASDYYYYVNDNNNSGNNYVASSHPLDDRLVIWARSILPASPLSGKNRNE